MPERVFTDADGAEWKVRTISSGRTSAYLNKKVHRPILEFRPASPTGPNRYAAIPADLPASLTDIDDESLAALLQRAKIH
ncbi:MAG: hypothetical protein ACE5FJ_03855 [Gemmatimonadales bacterium]